MAKKIIDAMWDDSPIDVSTEVNFIWSIANKLRGTYQSDKYKDVIIPMVIIRRFECALAPTKAKVLEQFKANPKYPAKAMYRISNYKFYNTSDYDLAELAYHLEREDIGLKGGKQDQYAAAFGGFNMMEFTKDGTVVNPVNLSEDIVWELEYRSLLCYTGKTRDSAGIIESQVESFKAKSNEEALDESKILSTKLADALKKGDIEEAGLLLDETWKQKKKFSSKITNPMIDDLYSTAIANGAYGGKVSGAGGGGFMYFICKNDRKHIVAKELQKKGAIVEDFVFEPRGARSWRAKI